MGPESLQASEQVQKWDPYAAWRERIRASTTLSLEWDVKSELFKTRIDDLLASADSVGGSAVRGDVLKDIGNVFIRLQDTFPQGQIVQLQFPPISSFRLAEILHDTQIQAEVAASLSTSAALSGDQPVNSLEVEQLSVRERERWSNQRNMPQGAINPAQTVFLVKERYARFVDSEAEGTHVAEAVVTGKYLVGSNREQEQVMLYPNEEVMRLRVSGLIFGSWRDVPYRKEEPVILREGKILPEPQPVRIDLAASNGQVAAMYAILGLSISDAHQAGGQT